MLVSLSSYAEFEFIPVKEYRPIFEFQDGSKKKLPVLDFGEVKGHNIRIFGVGNGAVSLDMVSIIRNGKWLTKETKGMWFLKEIRLTCPPLRNLNDESFKFYSPSAKEVEAGAPLEYKVDVPCNMDMTKFNKKLSDLADLMQVPFAGESLHCDIKKMSPACQELDTVTKILSGDYDLGKSFYCNIELNVGSGWEIPNKIDQIKSDENTNFDPVAYIEELFKHKYWKKLSSMHDDGNRIYQNERQEFLDFRKNLKKNLASIEKYQNRAFRVEENKGKTVGEMLMKDGKNFYKVDLEIKNMCSGVGGQENINKCKNEEWRKRYNIYDPQQIPTNSIFEYDEEVLKARKKEGLSNKQYHDHPYKNHKTLQVDSDCIYDEEVLSNVCKDL